MMKVALCIRGAISRRESDSKTPGSIYQKNYLINYKAVYNCIKKHIIDCNKMHCVDVFMHSWSFDLAGELESLYVPSSCAFEDNNLYVAEILERCRGDHEFSGVSQALSIKKVIEVKERYEALNQIEYDIVIIHRPDVFLWKDILIDKYDVSRGIFVNAHPDCNGDFHFVMSNFDSIKFKCLYDSPLLGNNYVMHHWIKNFVLNFMKKPIIMDDVIPGLHQDVARPHKMRAAAINIHKINPEFFEQYGITKDDLGI